MPHHSDLPESFFYTNVRTLAHYLYVVRGCREGRDVDDWLEAESQLKSYLTQEEINNAMAEASLEQIDQLLQAIEDGPDRPNALSD